MDEIRELEEKNRELFEKTALEKLGVLKQELGRYKSIAVAFSAGVDSTFLLTVARAVLGDGAVALTATSEAFPKRETNQAVQFCFEKGITHIQFPFDALSLEGFGDNPPDRCYHCKKALFSRFIQIAGEQGLEAVAEGSNVDDELDYRPGMRALGELGVISPLRTAGLTKEEIRYLSRELDLPTWDKRSAACLASRIAYNESITKEKLEMIDRAEQLLIDLGFSGVRVRMHDSIARIELNPDEFEKMLRQGIRERVYESLKQAGFSYVTLDLAGYRTGSMNEMLEEHA